ncbi:MAG TPA: hypothetical protein VFJ16_04890, partial [Longimicrobium sp.]|nr:hypothetical protein [Longimicrobium sp.]
MSEHDDAVMEVRRIREQIAARFGNDVDRYGEYISAYQKKFGFIADSVAAGRAHRSCRRVAAGGARAEYRNFFGKTLLASAATHGRPAVSTDRSGDHEA